MNKTVATAIAAVAVLALAVPAFAQNAGPRQGQGGPGGGGRMMMGGGRMMQEVQDRVLTKIGATADQKAKIKALSDKMRADMMKFMKDELKIDVSTMNQGRGQGGAGRGQAGGQQGGQNRQRGPQMTEEQRKKAMEFSQKQRTAHQAKMKEILGAKYDEYQKEMQAEMQKMRQNRPGGGAGRPGQGGGNRPPL